MSVRDDGRAGTGFNAAGFDVLTLMLVVQNLLLLGGFRNDFFSKIVHDGPEPDAGPRHVDFRTHAVVTKQHEKSVRSDFALVLTQQRLVAVEEPNGDQIGQIFRCFATIFGWCYQK